MPFTAFLPLISSGLQAGANIYTNQQNIKYQREANANNQQFAVQMYDRQRQDALTDMQFQNQYNSPAAQMQRLKAAGLNPNLVYDNGAAQTPSATVRSSSVPAYTAKAPVVDYRDTGNIVGGYLDARARIVQTDNVKALTEVAKQEAALKAMESITQGFLQSASAASTAKTKVETAAAEVALEQYKKLMPISLEQAQANLNKTYADTGFTLHQDERAAAMNAQTLQKGVEEILLLRKQQAKTDAERNHLDESIKVLRQDARIKKLDADLKAQGIQPHDPAFTRAVERLVNQIMSSRRWDDKSWKDQKSKMGLKFDENPFGME